MASTAAGVAVGSTIGHALGGLFGGGGGDSSTLPEQQQQQYQLPDQQQAASSTFGSERMSYGQQTCDGDAKNFTRCLEQNVRITCDTFLTKLVEWQYANMQLLLGTTQGKCFQSSTEYTDLVLGLPGNGESILGAPLAFIRFSIPRRNPNWMLRSAWCVRHIHITWLRRRADTRALPRDDEIKAHIITLVTSEGEVQRSQSIHAVRRSYDRTKYTLKCVSDKGPEPVCRLISLQEQRQKQREADAHAKREAKGNTPKELQISWQIAAGDLERRLKEAESFLIKGHRLSLLIASRKKTLAMSLPERTAFVEGIKERLYRVGKEWQRETVTPTRRQIYVQPKGKGDD